MARKPVGRYGGRSGSIVSDTVGGGVDDKPKPVGERVKTIFRKLEQLHSDKDTEDEDAPILEEL